MADRLLPSEQIGVDGSLTSQSGQFLLTLQGDSNIVLYNGATTPWTVVWAANTWHRGVVRLIMQGDGNLVAYTASSAPVWATNTWNHPGAWLKLEDDGRLVVYDANGMELWATGAASPIVTSAATQVRVEFINIHCDDTEDWTGADTVYLTGAVARSDGQEGAISWCHRCGSTTARPRSSRSPAGSSSTTR
jgi:hypothetical protein